MAITLTLRRASEESGLSIRTLYNKIGAGELASVKVGKRRLIPARALEEFLLRGGSPEQGRPSSAGELTGKPPHRSARK